MKTSATGSANPTFRIFKILAVVLLTACGSALGRSSSEQTADTAVAELGVGFISATVRASGRTLHYVRGGTGPAVILLHAFPEDWYEYHKVMPRLARKFTVVAVDLPGIGGSTAKPGGYAAAEMADDIHQLQEQLHLEHTYVVGHDIGGMVAYAFVRRYPEAARGAMILDVLSPAWHRGRKSSRSPSPGIFIFSRCPNSRKNWWQVARRFTSAISSILNTLATPTWLATPHLMRLQNTCMRPLRSTAHLPQTKNSMRNNRTDSSCRWY